MLLSEVKKGLTGLTPGDHVLPVTEDSILVSDRLRYVEEALTCRQRMPPYVRQRSLLWRADLHRTTERDQWEGQHRD
jgi:hypothetical protein